MPGVRGKMSGFGGWRFFGFGAVDDGVVARVAPCCPCRAKNETRDRVVVQMCILLWSTE